MYIIYIQPKIVCMKLGDSPKDENFAMYLSDEWKRNQSWLLSQYDFVYFG